MHDLAFAILLKFDLQEPKVNTFYRVAKLSLRPIYTKIQAQSGARIALILMALIFDIDAACIDTACIDTPCINTPCRLADLPAEPVEVEELS